MVSETSAYANFSLETGRARIKGNWTYSVGNNPVQNQTVHLFSVVFPYYMKRFHVVVRQITLFCITVFNSKMCSTRSLRKMCDSCLGQSST